MTNNKTVFENRWLEDRLVQLKEQLKLALVMDLDEYSRFNLTDGVKIIKAVMKKEYTRVYKTLVKDDARWKQYKLNWNDQLPKVDDIKQFPLWRKNEFDKNQNKFNEARVNSKQSVEYFKLKEQDEIIGSLMLDPLYKIFVNVVQNAAIPDYRLLAYVLGKLDHLQAVEKLTDINTEKNKEHSKGKKSLKYEKLEDVFVEKASFIQAVKALKTLKVIDENNKNNIGSKMKGAIQVWSSIVRNDLEIVKHVSDEDFTIFLNQYFIGLNLSENTHGKHLRNNNQSAVKKYRSKLLVAMKNYSRN